MLLEKYRRLLVLNILLSMVFLFSCNVLEDSLLINLFSITVLLSLFFSIKYSRANSLRAIRKYIKLSSRIQNKALKRSYFICLLVVKIKIKYLKKLVKKYFSIKYYKLILNSHIKINFFFYRLFFFKLYILSLASNFIANISSNLVTVFEG